MGDVTVHADNLAETAQGSASPVSSKPAAPPPEQEGLEDLEDDVDIAPLPEASPNAGSPFLAGKRAASRLRRLDQNVKSLDMQPAMQQSDGGAKDGQDQEVEEQEAGGEEQIEGEGEEEEDYAWDEEDEYAKHLTAGQDEAEEEEGGSDGEGSAGGRDGQAGSPSGSHGGDSEGSGAGEAGEPRQLRERGNDRIGGGDGDDEMEVEVEPLNDVLAKLRARKALVAARAQGETSLNTTSVAPQETVHVPPAPVDMLALLARCKAKQRQQQQPQAEQQQQQQQQQVGQQLAEQQVDKEQQRDQQPKQQQQPGSEEQSEPQGPSNAVVRDGTVLLQAEATDLSSEQQAMSMERTDVKRHEQGQNCDSSSPQAAPKGNAQRLSPPTTKGAPDMMEVDDGGDDDDLEIVGDKRTPGKGEQEARTADDQMIAALDAPALDVGVLRPPPRTTLPDPISNAGPGSRKVFSRGGLSRLSRLGSVTLVNHGVVQATKRQDSQTDGDAAAAQAAADITNGKSAAAESGGEEEDEDESVADGSEEYSGDERGSGSEDASGDEDEEGEEGESEEEASPTPGSEEPEAEPLAYEEMEPELEEEPKKPKGQSDMAAEGKADQRQGPKPKVSKPTKKRGNNWFVDMEAELSDEEEGAGDVSADEEEDGQEDGVLTELIGDVTEGRRDEHRRAQLHKQWQEERDAKDMRALVDGIRNGFKRPGKQMIGGEEGNDADARRRRAQLFGAAEMDDDDLQGQGVEQWAMALDHAAQDEDEPEEEGMTDDKAVQHAMRKRLRTEGSQPTEHVGPSSLPKVGSEELRELVRVGRTASLGAPLPVPAARPLAGAGALRGANGPSSGLGKPKAGMPFTMFGRELTNQAGPGKACQGTSFMGRSKAPVTHRSTSNAGGRSYVFGASEHSNVTLEGEAHKDANTNSMSGLPRPAAGPAPAARPTSFAGMQGLLGAAPPTVAQQVQSAVQAKKDSLFNLLNRA